MRAATPTIAIVIDAGAAFELMHAFALFHDDVMDDADSRRGQPTTHTTFAQRHADAGWQGESRRFGEGVAILIGDLAFVYSDQLMAGANATAWQIWNELRIELNVGQVLDILGSVRGVRDVAQAERICRYKSGKYTIERPLHLGAALAAPERFAELAPALSAFGLPLGDAFQMRDDVMGAFGDEHTTGKPVGGDLREGKPTPLLARARAAASPAQLACSTASATPTSATPTSPASSRSSSTPERSPTWSRPSTGSPPTQSPRSRSSPLDEPAAHRTGRARRLREPARRMNGLTCASS